MSVIATGMEICKCCGSCSMSGTDVCRKWFKLTRSELGEKRAEDCPLKSIDGLIEKIQHHRNKTKSIDKYDLVGDCIEIIKEYCEVSE